MFFLITAHDRQLWLSIIDIFRLPRSDCDHYREMCNEYPAVQIVIARFSSNFAVGRNDHKPFNLGRRYAAVGGH